MTLDRRIEMGLGGLRTSAGELACCASLTGAPQVNEPLGLSVNERRVPALSPLSGAHRARVRSLCFESNHLAATPATCAFIDRPIEMALTMRTMQ